VGAFTVGNLQGVAMGKLELNKTLYACFRCELRKD
jgi:hypothetical protein